MLETMLETLRTESRVGWDAKSLCDKLNQAEGRLVYTVEECARMVPIIREIEELKRERKATIIVHNYPRAILKIIADYVGDSLELAYEAKKAKETKVIVLVGVRFMAETAKLVNPDKTVLLPNSAAGCSLADSAPVMKVIETVDDLRKQYGDDLAVACYVNTSAEVKAECDVCVTSSNFVRILSRLPQKNILFLPDQHLAEQAAEELKGLKNIISWQGNCYVHHAITKEQILALKQQYPDAPIAVHPECRAEVKELADVIASTSKMLRFAKDSKADRIIMVTECGLAQRARMEIQRPIEVHGGCFFCAFMQTNTLEDVLHSLREMKEQIELPQEVHKKASRAIERMFELMKD